MTKPHIIRELVNDLRDISMKYHDHQSLWERIAHRVREFWEMEATPAVPDGWQLVPKELPAAVDDALLRKYGHIPFGWSGVYSRIVAMLATVPKPAEKE